MIFSWSISLQATLHLVMCYYLMVGIFQILNFAKRHRLSKYLHDLNHCVMFQKQYHQFLHQYKSLMIRHLSLNSLQYHQRIVLQYLYLCRHQGWLRKQHCLLLYSFEFYIICNFAVVPRGQGSRLNRVIGRIYQNSMMICIMYSPFENNNQNFIYF